MSPSPRSRLSERAHALVDVAARRQRLAERQIERAVEQLLGGGHRRAVDGGEFLGAGAVTRLTRPSALARAASIGSPPATSSKAALRPTLRTRPAITTAATMPCFTSG